MTFLSFMAFQILNHRSLSNLSMNPSWDSQNSIFLSFLFLENTNVTDGIQSYAFSSLSILCLGKTQINSSYLK